VLDGKVAIITGAAQGMGAAAARLFASEGATVVLADIDDKAGPLAAEIGPRASFFRHDVTDEQSWGRIIDDTVARFGRLDILVNNAGLFSPGTLQETKVETADLFYRVNQRGVLLGMQAVIEPMKKVGGGAIVNMSSCVAMRGVPGQFAYAASKWAVRGMTKCAAVELGPLGIRVNSIHPGPVETRMLDAWPQEQRAAVKAMIPLGRFGRSTDVAELMLFLASDRSSYISGAEVSIDGAIFA
jgi:3alpha(or 20beta)-hydroxysteroid dehydrogenase